MLKENKGMAGKAPVATEATSIRMGGIKKMGGAPVGKKAIASVRKAKMK